MAGRTTSYLIGAPLNLTVCRRRLGEAAMRMLSVNLSIDNLCVVLASKILTIQRER
jgi:hypothetical protein